MMNVSMSQVGITSGAGSSGVANGLVAGGQERSGGKSFAEILGRNLDTASAAASDAKNGSDPETGAVKPSDSAVEASAGAMAIVSEKAATNALMIAGGHNPLLGIPASESLGKEDSQLEAAINDETVAETDEASMMPGIQVLMAGLTVSGASGENISKTNAKPDVNPGKQHLIEKLQASTDRVAYDAETWLAKPVQDIMKEIKANRLEARVAAVENTAGLQPAETETIQTATPVKAESLLKPETGGLIGLEGFVEADAAEMKRFTEILKQQFGENETGRTAMDTNEKGRAAIDTNETEQGAVLAVGASDRMAAAAVPESSAGTEQPEAFKQISGEILSKLEQKGPMEFRMKLSPENLGNIDVRIKVSEGKLIIDIMSASARTHNLLAGQVDQLIANLGLQNVHVESVSVNQQGQASAADLTEQMLAMGAGMDFSHRKGQDHSAGREGRPGARTVVDDARQTVQAAEGARMIRSRSARLDYAV